MKYIVIVFNLLNKLKNYFSFEGSYSEFNNYMRKLEDDITLDKDIRNEIINCLNSLEVEKEDECIAILLNPGISIEELSFDKSIYDLNDTQLINYFGSVMWSVTVLENGNLMLLKYNECIWNTGWHNYALECRGKVIDKTNFNIVSYPFDKFFNFNENKITEENVVINNLKNAYKVSLTNKLDGSTIIVSNYNGKPLVTTNGSFDNEQIAWAIEIFNNKYKYFYDNIPYGYTFVFELIHPENRIILDYGDTCDVYLIAVRNNALFCDGLFSFDKTIEFAEKYKLSIVEQEVFTSLDNLCEMAHKMKNANKEGWVLRTENKEGYVNYMFKLKLDEYFILHRARAHVSVKNIYKLYSVGMLDEFLNSVDDLIKQEVIDTLEIINICIGKVHNEVIKKAELVINELNINNVENKEDLIKVVKETNKDKLFGAYVLSYIKTGDINYSCCRMRLSKFMNFYKYFNM